MLVSYIVRMNIIVLEEKRGCNRSQTFQVIDFDAFYNGQNATMKVIMQKEFYVRYDKRTKRRYPPDVQAIYDYRKLYEQSFVTFYKTLRPDGSIEFSI